MTLPVNKRLINVDEYHRMGEAGILTEEDKVELIQGEILHMSPIGSKHSSIVDRINQLFVRLFSENAIIRIQGPIRLDKYSEPQPDISILHPVADFYAAKHPGPKDVILVVEVSDSSLEFDRQIKLPVYATAGISEYWLVDVENHQIEVYRNPVEDLYKSKEFFQADDSISISDFPELKLKVSDLLG